jgi:nucleoside-diphosphate-sugar epimerase
MIKENELADENFSLNPLSLYAKAKVTNEQYLLEKRGNVDYKGVILRFATAFGLSPRMRFDLTISEFVRDIYFGKELLVFDEHTWRPYCHVRDFARLLELVIKTENDKVNFEVFNAGGNINNYTKKMIVDEILRHIPEGKVRYGENGSDPRNYRVSFAKVKERLGFEPEFTVKDGIKELIDSLKIGLFKDSIMEKNKYGNYVI